MSHRIDHRRTALAAALLWVALAPGPHAASDCAVLPAPSIQELSASTILPPTGQAGGWTPSGPSERYVKESLYGYIDGGAELVLPYGFEELAVGRYVTAGNGGREITIEIYRTATGLDAFGLFSVQRDGREEVSPSLASPHWLSPSQACLAKGSIYVSLTGFGTSASDLEGVLKAVAARIPETAPTGLEARFRALPVEGRAPRSERFIKGESAARAETQFFSEPAWGFGRGATAVSARYEPGGLKLIVIDAGPAGPKGLDDAVRAQFEANLEGIEARPDRLSARNGAGQTFLYARRGGRALLAWGKDEEAAAALLERAGR